MLSFAVASSSFVAPGSRLSTQVSRGASVSMGSTADFKNGLTLEDENSVWKITSFLHVRRPVDTAVSVVPQLTTPALQAAVAAAAAATAAAAAAAATAATAAAAAAAAAAGAASGRPASASTIRPCCAQRTLVLVLLQWRSRTSSEMPQQQQNAALRARGGGQGPMRTRHTYTCSAHAPHR